MKSQGLDTDQGFHRRGLLVSTLALGLTGATSTAQSSPVLIKGRLVQGGYALIKAQALKTVFVDGLYQGKTSASGDLVIGLDRDANPRVSVTVDDQPPLVLDVAAGRFDIQRVDGLPPQTVTPTDPQILKRTKLERALKAEAFKSRLDAIYFVDGFRYPLEKFRISGHFGNQRVLNGEPKSPHMGFDMAAPTGTPVLAPQKGLVIFAEPEMFFEGGLILLDHGQGLISMYLHMSKLLAQKDQIIEQGDTLGLVGAKGRATGAHLCWRLKWREAHMDPSLMVKPYGYGAT
jgi:murein DD-endopeptidase MepM/ murein hydrolase activator NlpD